VAGFTASLLSGAAPLTVTFTNTTTGDVTGYEWAFGDGATSVVTHPTHVYTAIGAYTVSLTATGPGGSDTLTRTDYVTVTPGGPVTTTRVISYTYDPLGRLVEADYSTGESYEYAYDAVGNRTAMTETITSTVVTTYTYNAANQLVTARASDNGVTWHYTFDRRGNLVRQTPGGMEPAEGETRYTYDGASQLARVELYTAGDYTTLAEAVYNADGERVRLTSWAEGVPLTVTYGVFQGELLVAGDGTQATLHLYGRNLIAGHGDEGWAYHLRDGEGSLRQIVGESGAVTLARTYKPFGGILEEQGQFETAFGFLGAQLDRISGLLYADGRYYDPATGRFLTPDRSFDPYNPRTLNPYAPWQNPGLWLLAPLVVLAAFRMRKKGRRYDQWLVLLLVGISMSAFGCGDGDTPPLPPTEPPTLPPTEPPPGPTPAPPPPTPPPPVPDVELLKHSVHIYSFRNKTCLPSNTPGTIIITYGDATAELGTVVDGGATILTHNHFERWDDIVGFSFTDYRGNRIEVDRSDILGPSKDRGTRLLILPSQINLQTDLDCTEAPLGYPDAVVVVGDVQVVYYQSAGRLSVLRTSIRRINEGDVRTVTLDDPDMVITGGDSGGGLFQGGKLVGNTWSVTKTDDDVRLDSFTSALLPDGL